MKLDHVSISFIKDSGSEVSPCYKIRAELNGIPGKQWQDGLKFVWYNSPFYLCKKCELTLEENSVALFLTEGTDLQSAVETLSRSVTKADKMVRSTGLSGAFYLSDYRRSQLRN